MANVIEGESSLPLPVLVSLNLRHCLLFFFFFLTSRSITYCALMCPTRCENVFKSAPLAVDPYFFFDKFFTPAAIRRGVIVAVYGNFEVTQRDFFLIYPRCRLRLNWSFALRSDCFCTGFFNFVNQNFFRASRLHFLFVYSVNKFLLFFYCMLDK